MYVFTNAHIQQVHLNFHPCEYNFKKYFFLTRELSLINTCCWRADQEILTVKAEVN